MVPEAQHPVALLPQELISLFVGGVRGRVLAAVQLDEQLFGQTGEVGDVRADGLLAVELVAAQLFVAQAVPQEACGVGLALAHGLDVVQGFGGVLAFDVGPGAWGWRGAGFPPPARLRAGALVSPTPPQGGSDGAEGVMGGVVSEGGLGAHGVEIDEPGFEQCPRHGLQGLVHAPVQFDLVVQRAQDVGDGALFGKWWEPKAKLLDSTR